MQGHFSKFLLFQVGCRPRGCIERYIQTIDYNKWIHKGKPLLIYPYLSWQIGFVTIKIGHNPMREPGLPGNVIHVYNELLTFQYGIFNTYRYVITRLGVGMPLTQSLNKLHGNTAERPFNIRKVIQGLF